MATDNEPVAHSELISRLSYRPYEIDRGMIRIRETPKPSHVDRSPASSTGALNRLPPEVIHSILDWLDFQSLYRFSLASIRAHEVVHTLPAHRDLFLHAPSALAALGRTRLIAHHPAREIRAVLRSWKCISCTQYGAYLFLPTCERCCWDCLENNQSLWVLPRGVAAKCFSLSSAQLDQLPTLLSITGEYCVGRNSHMRDDRQKLVSVRAAKELALTVHGSEQEISKLAGQIPRISQKRLSQYKHYHAAQLLRPRVDDAARSGGKLQATDMNDPFPGMASLSFPSTTENGIEHGFWCRGCDYLFETYALRFFPTISGRLPLWTLFMSMRRRGFSHSQFLAHIRTCYGVQRIATQSGLEAWSRGIHDVDAPPLSLSEVLSLLLKPESRSSHDSASNNIKPSGY